MTFQSRLESCEAASGTIKPSQHHSSHPNLDKNSRIIRNDYLQFPVNLSIGGDRRRQRHHFANGHLHLYTSVDARLGKKRGSVNRSATESTCTGTDSTGVDIDASIDVDIDDAVDRRTDKQMDRRTDGRRNRRTDGRTVRRMRANDETTPFYTSSNCCKSELSLRNVTFLGILRASTRALKAGSKTSFSGSPIKKAVDCSNNFRSRNQSRFFSKRRSDASRAYISINT